MPRNKVPERPSKSKRFRPNQRSKKTAQILRTGKAQLLSKLRRISPFIDLNKIWEHLAPKGPVEFRISFARPDDLLVCDFIFDNLILSGADGARKVTRNEAGSPATLIVELPPQSFGEQAFLDYPDLETVASLPSAKIRMAGRSRLAFVMPIGESDLEFTLEAILDACRRWPMGLEPNALPDPDSSLVDRRKEFGVLTKDWLREASSSRAHARSALLRAAGLGSQIEKSLGVAARRIAWHAAEILRNGATQAAAAGLERSLKQEVDRIAENFAPLHDAARRDVALAALSLMTTEAFASSKGDDFVPGRISDFPFVSVFLVPHQPSPLVTALELPYRVILSPIPEANWWHETKPIIHNGRTELWHTGLTKTKDGIGPALPTKVRALWSPDYDLSKAEITDVVNNAKPFLMSLNANDRQSMVELMAGFDQKSFVPHAAEARRLQLSALGALLDVEGHWENLPEGIALEQWRHLATLGRDHYVRVAYRGVLCPFGHAAVLVVVTERKFESLPRTKNRVAVLRQRSFIRVRERIKNYDGTGHVFHGNNFPFLSVEMLTHETPDLWPFSDIACALDDPNGTIYKDLLHQDCFWPMLRKTDDFLFQIAATDLSGQRVTFAMPLLFVGKNANEKHPKIDNIVKQYNAAPLKPRRTASFGSASICFAPLKPGAEGDPKLPTMEVTFDAGSIASVPLDKAQFYPEIEAAQVGIAAIQRLLQKPDAIIGVTYPDVYKTGAFGGGNPGEVFLKTLNPLPLEFGGSVKSDTLGGLSTPNMSIQGLSRIMGPVAAQPPANPSDIESALAQVIGNVFNPADFFKGAKILGGVELASILGLAPSLAGADVPKLLSTRLPDKIEARFDWHTNINKSDPLGLFVPNAGGITTLDMHGVVSSPIAKPDATTFKATASVVNFKVNLFGFVTVWFDRLQFTSQTGSKPDVAVELHPGDETIAFGGPLEFVNELRKIIPSNGFSDPPSLLVTPSGLSASYSINLPSVAVGIFALEHVSLGAGFALPFDGSPAEVRFNFAERQRPFSLTVSLLGGGGFFAIGVGTEGVREIEAALEFGAAVSINLGVASGSVEIKAGVYFHWLKTSVELAGYVRLHGELSVLGLISASLTFNLQLAYLKESHHSVVWGEATLEVEIDVLFLSFSVSVSCRREFGGSDADPKFIELVPDVSTWTDYCNAFAVEGV